MKLKMLLPAVGLLVCCTIHKAQAQVVAVQTPRGSVYIDKGNNGYYSAPNYYHVDNYYHGKKYKKHRRHAHKKYGHRGRHHKHYKHYRNHYHRRPVGCLPMPPRHTHHHGGY